MFVIRGRLYAHPVDRLAETLLLAVLPATGDAGESPEAKYVVLQVTESYHCRISKDLKYTMTSTNIV